MRDGFSGGAGTKLLTRGAQFSLSPRPSPQTLHRASWGPTGGPSEHPSDWQSQQGPAWLLVTVLRAFHAFHGPAFHGEPCPQVPSVPHQADHGALPHSQAGPPQPQGQPWDGAVSVTHRAVTTGTQAGLGDLSGSPWEWSSSGNLRECLVCVLEKQTPVLWSCRGECAQTSSSEQSQSNRQDSGEPCSIPAGLLHPRQQEQGSEPQEQGEDDEGDGCSPEGRPVPLEPGWSLGWDHVGEVQHVPQRPAHVGAPRLPRGEGMGLVLQEITAATSPFC